MYSPLEPSSDCGVKLPGDVGCAKDKDASRVTAYAIHLDEEFGFYAPRGFGLAFATGAAEGVDFVDEDDGRFVFAGHVEELLY